MKQGIICQISIQEQLALDGSGPDDIRSSTISESHLCVA